MGSLRLLLSTVRNVPKQALGFVREVAKGFFRGVTAPLTVYVLLLGNLYLFYAGGALAFSSHRSISLTHPRTTLHTEEQRHRKPQTQEIWDPYIGLIAAASSCWDIRVVMSMSIQQRGCKWESFQTQNQLSFIFMEPTVSAHEQGLI